MFSLCSVYIQCKSFAKLTLTFYFLLLLSPDASTLLNTTTLQDPNGQQHHCCGTTGNSSLYCPTSGFLSTITDLEVWAEGMVR